MRTIQCVDHYGKIHQIPVDRFIIRVSAFGVLEEAGKIFMIKDGWSKKWEFPGGGLKVGETLSKGLQRECIEETGLEIIVINLITFQEDYFYAEDRDKAWQSVRLFFRIKKTGGEIKQTGNGHDSIDVQFLSREKLTQENTKPSVFTLLKQL